MSTIAIITARGGSKRIPGKNIKDFCGKPIIAYSIEAAIKSNLFDEVMVSTDSQQIAEVAKEYGASVPFLRSAETSTDYATTADVVEEVINTYQSHGKHFDCFACIYPTAPFLTGDRLREAMKCFESSGADGMTAVVKFSFPPQRAFVIKDGRVEYQYPEYALMRSQDIEPLYHDCGQFYICNTDAFMKEHSMILKNTVPYELKEDVVQDIDTLSDWAVAEAKFSAISREKGK